MVEETHTGPKLYKIVWTVIFGVSLALGGTILEPFPVPWLSITAASPYVALMITLNKLIVFRRFSVTYMYLIAGIVAIFTTYLGPPSILKPIYIIAGLSFDAFTFFRTDKLKFWNLALGHLAITITGFGIFWLLILIMIPGSASAIAKILFFAAPFHYLISIIVAYLVFRAIPPNNPPRIIQEIRSQMIDE